MLILDKEERRYAAGASNAIRAKLDRDPADHVSIRWAEPHSLDVLLDLDVAGFLTYFPPLPDGRPERGAEYAEGELWTQRMLYDAVKRKNAALEAELETRKKRESLLLELLKHERENRRPPGRKPKKASLSDLKRIQCAFADLSREDIVRAVRSARDAG